MATMRIDLRGGFDRDPVEIWVDEDRRWREEAVTTKFTLDLAASVPLEVPDGPADVRLVLPGRGSSSLGLVAGDTTSRAGRGRSSSSSAGAHSSTDRPARTLEHAPPIVNSFPARTPRQTGSRKRRLAPLGRRSDDEEAQLGLVPVRELQRRPRLDDEHAALRRARAAPARRLRPCGSSASRPGRRTPLPGSGRCAACRRRRAGSGRGSRATASSRPRARRRGAGRPRGAAASRAPRRGRSCSPSGDSHTGACSGRVSGTDPGTRPFRQGEGATRGWGGAGCPSRRLRRGGSRRWRRWGLGGRL